MTLVVDASVVVSALTDSGRVGQWAEEILQSDHLVAPHLLPVEVTDVLRRAALAGKLSSDLAALAFGDLQAVGVDLYPFSPFASRVWSLRDNVSAYDAWYVALAELLGADLATLDLRIGRAPGIRCSVRTPD
ncbi:MAG: type II toxin-antitoxin system VapC family toxin [Gemmatimonadetes bacterium]|nr:type II toxin-antitoxin system VapC family toxin [Gemmatimonadota bacterium]